MVKVTIEHIPDGGEEQQQPEVFTIKRAAVQDPYFLLRTMTTYDVEWRNYRADACMYNSANVLSLVAEAALRVVRQSKSEAVHGD